MEANRLCFNIKLCGLLVILKCYISSSDAVCSPTRTNIKRFGTDCRFACHCMNNGQCDFKTGDCVSGCDFEWVGPGCQYRNIALERTARESDSRDISQYAQKAIDRDLSTCSSTEIATAIRRIAPWFTVWLPYKTTFKELIFTTKYEYLSQFPGFNLTVQNMSVTGSRNKVYDPSGILCYQHDASVPQDSTVNITCTGTPVGNQIRLQLANTSTQLVLCDFRIYSECKDRSWGTSCENVCGLCKDLASCDVTNGHCITGCESGYVNTSTCDSACENGKYGHNCTHKCSGHCKKNVTCNKQSGACLDGCSPGYIGEKCEKECDNGTYGTNCQKTCNENCNDVCNKTNGQCKTCRTGWHGFNCSTACSEGYWGENCMRLCGKCMSGRCDRIDGACSENCQPGYKFKLHCDEECDMGWYGDNCTGQCSQVCGDVSLCRKSDGMCLSDRNSSTKVHPVSYETFGERNGLNGMTMAAVVGAVTLTIGFILGVLTMYCCMRRTRNGTAFCGDKTENFTNSGLAMSEVPAAASDRNSSTKVHSVSYETIGEGNADDHLYDSC